MEDQRFPKSCRLLDSKAFERVFNKPDFRVSNQYFLILGRKTDLANSRLGIIVARKNIAKATRRNRIKRLIRETFRKRKSKNGSVDLVVLTKKGVEGLENSKCQTYIHVLMDELDKKKQTT